MSDIKTTKEIRDDLSGVDFSQNGEIVLSIELTDLPKEILTHLALHGIAQKLGDSYAGIKDPSEAVTKATSVKERLVVGDWKAARTSASPRSTQLAEALASVFKKTVDEAITVIASLDKGQIADLRKDASVSAALQSIAAKRAAEKAAKANADLKGAAPSGLSNLFG